MFPGAKALSCRPIVEMLLNIVPNLLQGCMWSVCGVHDQGWAERPVFGKIRYMNYNGCKRKFDVGEFVRKHGKKKQDTTGGNDKILKNKKRKAAGIS